MGFIFLSAFARAQIPPTAISLCAIRFACCETITARTTNKIYKTILKLKVLFSVPYYIFRVTEHSLHGPVVQTAGHCSKLQGLLVAGFVLDKQ